MRGRVTRLLIGALRAKCTGQRDVKGLDRKCSQGGLTTIFLSTMLNRNFGCFKAQIRGPGMEYLPVSLRDVIRSHSVVRLHSCMNHVHQ